jgi:hypothetical protein
MCILLLTACSRTPSSLQFGLDEAVVKQAIALQLNQREQVISQSLSTPVPQLEISQIKIDNIEPIFIADLPSYHLKGTYNLILNLPRQQVTQKLNAFEIYLQRQLEGKTWRLLERNNQEEEHWFTYSIYLP